MSARGQIGNSNILAPDNNINYPISVNKLLYKNNNTGKYNKNPRNNNKSFLLVGPGLPSKSYAVSNANTIGSNRIFRTLDLRYNSKATVAKQFNQKARGPHASRGGR